MMVMDSGGSPGQPATSPRNTVRAENSSLKKKKSLTRLFSASTRKFSQSRPASQSGDESFSPPTPHVPSHFWPLTPKTPGSRNPSATSIDRVGYETTRPGKREDGQGMKGGRSGATTARASTKRTDHSESKTLQDKGVDGIHPKSSIDHGKIHTARSFPTPPPEIPPMHQSPISSVLRKQLKTGLRLPSTFASLPRDRGASVTVLNTKSTPALPHSSRPATSAGHDNSKKKTGKRKPDQHALSHDGVSPSTIPTNALSPSLQRSWKNTYTNDEVRSSFRSALTTSSSHLETTSVDRSSVLTEETSITDSTTNPHSRPGSKAGGMTVDDAIDMYVTGFADDTILDLSDSRDTSPSEEERRRSARIAEAISDSIGSLLPPMRPLSTSSNAIMSSKAFRSNSPIPPPIMRMTSDRDQYGFLKSNHYVAHAQYEAWSAIYLPNQERRIKKWASYMREQGLSTTLPIRFPSRTTKTQRFIRKGIPPSWRGSAWFYYAGGDAYLNEYPDLYTSLVSRSEADVPLNDKESIERDLHRTFPDNIHFKPDPLPQNQAIDREPPLLISLRRILRAFALHSPKIGYCQSLNFLAGLLLLFLREEQAFWMLHIITTVYLPGTHEISLEGANVDLWVLMVALKSTLPGIWAKVGSAGASEDIYGTSKLPPISLCTTSWFMSLFIGTLPIESVLRIWDVLFYEGSRTLFRVALTIFRLGEQRIRDVSDSMELFQVVQGLPRGMLDASILMQTVCKRGGVGGEWVERGREERREWYAKERAIAAFSNGSMSESIQGAGEEMGRRSSVWRRRKPRGALGGVV